MNYLYGNYGVFVYLHFSKSEKKYWNMGMKFEELTLKIFKILGH